MRVQGAPVHEQGLGVGKPLAKPIKHGEAVGVDVAPVCDAGPVQPGHLGQALQAVLVDIASTGYDAIVSPLVICTITGSRVTVASMGIERIVVG